MVKKRHPLIQYLASFCFCGLANKTTLPHSLPNVNGVFDRKHIDIMGQGSFRDLFYTCFKLIYNFLIVRSSSTLTFLFFLIKFSVVLVDTSGGNSYSVSSNAPVNDSLLSPYPEER